MRAIKMDISRRRLLAFRQDRRETVDDGLGLERTGELAGCGLARHGQQMTVYVGLEGSC